MYNDVDTLESLVRMVVSDSHPVEIRELISQLPADEEDAIEAFCDRKELGGFIYEAMLLYQIDLPLLLDQIAASFEEQMREEQNEDSLLQSSLRSAQGW